MTWLRTPSSQTRNWALIHNLPLATLNLKDYEDFRQYHGLRALGTD